MKLSGPSSSCRHDKLDRSRAAWKRSNGPTSIHKTKTSLVEFDVDADILTKICSWKQLSAKTPGPCDSLRHLRCVQGQVQPNRNWKENLGFSQPPPFNNDFILFCSPQLCRKLGFYQWSSFKKMSFYFFPQVWMKVNSEANLLSGLDISSWGNHTLFCVKGRPGGKLISPQVTSCCDCTSTPICVSVDQQLTTRRRKSLMT